LPLKLIDHLNNYQQLEESERDFLTENIPVKKFAKKDILLEQGQVSQNFYFVISGCVRLYYNTNGEEKTAFFYTENQFVSSYKSFVQQLPTHHNLQCIEESYLATISKENANLLLKTFPKFEFLARMIMEEELMIYQEVISSFITLSPEERYMQLQKKQPELIQRIPQHYLATYLGVKPESLSRIRKRIASSSIS